MIIDYSSVTEIPGQKVSMEELRMIYCRYDTASKYAVNKRVLEVGCGPGLGFNYLIKNEVKLLIGGDITESNIKYAETVSHECSNAYVLLFDAQQLPFKQNSFDVILCFEVIFYLKQAELLLSECKRILSKNGLLVLCLPNKAAPGFRPSPFSIEYFNSLQLYNLLQKYFSEVNIYGAFPIKGILLKQSFFSFVRFITAKIFNFTEIGSQIKERLKVSILNRNILLSCNIKKNSCLEESLIPIDKKGKSKRYRILYAVARQ